jgi:hypothetical protein
MPAILTFDNLIIHSVDSRILAILSHGHYTPGSGVTTVPVTAKLIWHSDVNNYGVLTKGARYITGSRSANVLLDFGMTLGGQQCTNYMLSTNPGEDMGVKGLQGVDFVTTKPGTSEPLSTVWDAMQSRGLDYKWVHYFACRVPRA